jgi:type I restriction enzyme S subunit
LSKIFDLINKLCPNGVEYKELGEVSKTFAGGTPSSTNNDYYNGDIPWLRSGEINFNVINKTDKSITKLGLEKSSARWIKEKSVLLAMTGATVARSAVNLIPLTANQSVCAIEPNENILDYKFLYYCFANDYLNLKSLGQGVLTSLNLAIIKKISIPIPPLEVQEEIVRILDLFTALIFELKAELEARKKQYEYYRNKLLNFEGKNVEWKTLGDIGKACMCKRIMKHQTSSTGEIPFYKIGTFGKIPDAYITKALYEEYKNKFSFPPKGAILISASGTIGRTVIYDGKPGYFQDSNIVWIDNDETKVLNKFLYYYYGVIKWETDGGTIARLYNERLLKTKIPIPSLTEQQRIVEILDKFDTLVNDLSIGIPAEIEARQKQYEYYRGKLLSFKKLDK